MGKPIKWRPEQQKCIRARGGTLLVSAAAGSGKTAVLVERLVGRITDQADPVSVNELLVVTFTNASAAEMKSRLAKNLSDYLRDHPDARGLRRQQLLLPTADVCTMDAFCQRLVRDNALSLGLQADFKIADDSQTAFLKHDAYDEAVTAAFESNDPAFLQLYNTVRDYAQGGLHDTVFQLHAFLRTMANPARYIDEQRAWLSDPAATASPKAGDDVIPLTGEDKEHSATLLLALFDLMDDFDRRFTEKKAEANLLDFNDILHYALQLLAKRDGGRFITDDAGDFVQSDFAAALCQHFREIYVDEYQDTNDLQNALYRLLSQNEQNLFFVGDAKQSIYGFRGTSPKSFLQRRDTYTLSDSSEQDVSVFPATVALDCNFRSRRSTVAAVNFLFAQLMQKPCGGIDYRGQEELVFGAKYNEETEPLYTPTLLLLDDSPSAKEACEREATVIATEIKKMMQNPAIRLPDGDGKTRAPEYRDFCILLRSTANRDFLFAQTLVRHGIPAITGSGQKTFFSEVEIRWVLSLLRCIDNPLLDVSMLSVLMSPLYGFSPDDLAKIRIHSRDTSLFVALKQAAEADDPLGRRCAAFLEQLSTWRTLAATVPADRLLWDIYERTHLLDFCSMRENGAAREQNLRLLLDYARNFEQNRFRGLSAFLRFFDRLCENDEQLPAANVVGECAAVRIMTIHKSKGLEFPFVFVADLGKSFSNQDTTKAVVYHEQAGIATKWLDETSLEMHKPAYRDYVIACIKHDALCEEMRLLYVALTRAREKLYLVGSFKNLDKKLADLADLVTEDPLLPAGAVLSLKSYGEWILLAMLRHPCAAKLRERAHAEHLPLQEDDTPFTIAFPLPETPTEESKAAVTLPPSDERLEAQLRERFAYEYPHKALSSVPSKLAASSVAHTDKRHEYAAKAVPSFLKKEGLSAAEKGTATHAFMQYAAWERAADDVAAERERLVADGKLTRAQADAVELPCVSAFFAHPLYQRIAAADAVWRELPFTYALSVGDYKKLATVTLPTSSEEDETETLLVQGIADCVFEEDGHLVILDYKTDRGQSMEQLRDHYAPQLKLYAKALAERLGKPVVSCLLYSFANNDVIETGTEI